MRRIVAVLAGIAWLGTVWCLAGPAGSVDRTTLRFEVSVAKGLLPGATDGRLLLVLARQGRGDPRLQLGRTGVNTAPVLGTDAIGLKPGMTVVLDRTSDLFPLDRLERLPRGDYQVQAVFDHSRAIRLPNAPGNLVSEVKKVTLDPAAGGVIRLELTRALPESPVKDTEDVRFIHLRSEKLSRFHGRPIYLRAGVILPQGHARDKERTYPLRVHIGGFGTRYTAVLGMMQPWSAYRRVWADPRAPKMLLLHLDGAGPLGDPYQVDSANHGPFGAAITEELIPHVEKQFRGIGKPHARVLDGASTGGWVSLALQIFYPDFFQGAWSHCPDPVDFRAFELIDIYRHDNAYLNPHGFERPAMRTIAGDTVYTVRHEVGSEAVLGRGGRWTLSGKDWGSWNATFGPRGADGLPVPLWDGKTGKIDRKAAEHWKKYDLRLHLEKNWTRIGPRLRDKLRIWVGDADDYYLNNAVHLLEDWLKSARPPFAGKITYGPRKGHSWQGLTQKEMIDEMAAAVEKGKAER